MIFVILGTQKFTFQRLLVEIERLTKEKKLKHTVVVQAGYTKYESEYLIIKDFMNKEEFDQNIMKADFIITHGGTGAIISSLKLNKKVLAFPRLSQYGEHVDNHQEEIINAFVQKGYILTGNLSELEKLIEQLIENDFATYKSNNQCFLELINNCLEDNHD